MLKRLPSDFPRSLPFAKGEEHLKHGIKQTHTHYHHRQGLSINSQSVSCEFQSPQGCEAGVPGPPRLLTNKICIMNQYLPLLSTQLPLRFPDPRHLRDARVTKH